MLPASKQKYLDMKIWRAGSRIWFQAVADALEGRGWRMRSGEIRTIASRSDGIRPSRRALVLSMAAFAMATGFAETGRTEGMAFQDPLMKLFVVSELMRLKRIDLGPYEAFHARLLGRPHDAAIDGFRANPKALDYFARLALSADDLAAVEQLELDGGNPIFRYIDPNWQGYTDGIDEVKRLDDIALLPNLVDFGASTYLADRSEDIELSLAPFRGRGRLKRINATIVGYRDLDVLLELPSLVRCDLMGNRIYDDVMTAGHPSRTVMETLRSRGVKVRVHWTSHSGPPWPKAFE
jgi:hypothetical protein